MHNNTLDTALLIIRLGLGLTLMTHGANKIFGVGGIAGTARWFEALGFRRSFLHAWAAGSTEIGGGLMMCLGLFFPVPCAAFVGLMTVAAFTDHRGNGFFVFKGGWEYVALLAVIAGALGLTGAGRWSLDRVIGFHRIGFGWGVGAMLVGLAAGATTVVAFVLPLTKEASA